MICSHEIFSYGSMGTSNEITCLIFSFFLWVSTLPFREVVPDLSLVVYVRRRPHLWLRSELKVYLSLTDENRIWHHQQEDRLSGRVEVPLGVTSSVDFSSQIHLLRLYKVENDPMSLLTTFNQKDFILLVSLWSVLVKRWLKIII